MRVYPAIDLWEGKVCFLSPEPGGPPRRVSADPLRTAREWASRGAERLHLVDLNRALGQGDNADVIDRILTETPLAVEVGGGIREESRIAELIDRGADRVIVSTRALQEPSWLDRVARSWPGRMILAIDRKGSRALVAGRTSSSKRQLPRIWAEIGEAPLAGVLVTNVETEGRLAGVGNVPELPALPRSWERIAAGGISTPDDMARLSRAGFDAGVVGYAAYQDPTLIERLRTGAP